MAKETYYFQHDYEPLSDLKLSALVGEFGAVGYGLYWRIVELLHSESEHKLAHKKYNYSALAKQMLTSVEQVENMLNYAIEVCELFCSDGEYFWSNRVLRNIDKRNVIIEKRSFAGKMSAEKRKKATHDEHMLTHVQQNSTKESKVKEIKEKKISNNVHPTFEEVKNYCLERNNSVDPQKWIDYYTANGWKVGRNTMKDWKAAVRTWEKNGYENNSRNNEAGRKHRDVPSGDYSSDWSEQA
jgi:hypothetical protein